jgi:hypothetical protein
MSTRGHEKLFQKSGTEANLRYLWSRLAERDLARDEALAMLSAVHRELGRSEADDPRLYVSYARFMGSLQRDMPAIHQHVVKTWGQSHHHPVRAEPARRDEPAVIEGETVESLAAATPRPLADTGLRRFIRAVQLEVGGGEGPEEPGEPDEDHAETGEVERGPKGGGSIEAKDDEDPDEEDEDPVGKSSERAEARTEEEDLEGLSGEQKAAEAQELDPEEFDVPEDAHSEYGEDEDLDSLEEHSSESDEAEELGSESGSGDAHGGAENAGGEQTEWPAEEQPEAAEGFEEFDGEEPEAPAVD